MKTEIITSTSNRQVKSLTQLMKKANLSVFDKSNEIVA
jgi:hypothetical protein